MVMEEVFELFGDVRAREEAMRAAVPDPEKSKQLKKDIENSEKVLERILKRKDNIIDSIEKGLITDTEVKKRMDKIRDEEARIKERIESAKRQYDKVATEEQIKQAAGSFKYESLGLQIEHSRLGSKAHVKELTQERKRSMLQAIFSEKFTEDGQERRSGVYVKKGQQGWLYTIKGACPSVTGRVNSHLKEDSGNFQFLNS